MYFTIAAIRSSLNALPNAGIAPGLPSLMRWMISASVSVVPINFGPLPASRPAPLWHQPQVLANSFSTSDGAFESAGGGAPVA